MITFLSCVLLVSAGCNLVQWGIRRFEAQEEFEDQQAQFMVELSSRYDYRTNMFRP